jgi:hypothetical protein
MEAATDGGLLEAEPHVRMPGDAFDGPELGPFRIGQVTLNVAVGQSGVNHIALDVAGLERELGGRHESSTPAGD